MLPRVLGLTRARSRKAARPSSWERSISEKAFAPTGPDNAGDLLGDDELLNVLEVGDEVLGDQDTALGVGTHQLGDGAYVRRARRPQDAEHAVGPVELDPVRRPTSGSMLVCGDSRATHRHPCSVEIP